MSSSAGRRSVRVHPGCHAEGHRGGPRDLPGNLVGLGQGNRHGIDDRPIDTPRTPLGGPETPAEKLARLEAENAPLRAEKAKIETEKLILRQAAGTRVRSVHGRSVRPDPSLVLGDEGADHRRRGSLSRTKEFVAALRTSMVCCSSSAFFRFGSRISRAAELVVPSRSRRRSRTGGPSCAGSRGSSPFGRRSS